MARALYGEWFANFRFPGHIQNNTVKSTCGCIPKGWTAVRVGEVSKIYRGKSYRGTDLVEEGGLPFLNLKCIARGGGFRRDGVKRYAGNYKEEHICKAGDIVVAVTDMTQERRLIAHAARVPKLDCPNSVFSMDLVRIEPRADIPKPFLLAVLRFSGFADAVKQHANGVNVLHLNPERIGSFEFPLPPLSLMEQYATFFDLLNQQCDTLELKIANLRRTRDLLLPKLISGELDVEKLDIAISEVEEIGENTEVVVATP